MISFLLFTVSQKNWPHHSGSRGSTYQRFRCWISSYNSSETFGIISMEFFNKIKSMISILGWMLFVLRSASSTCYRLGYTIPTCLRAILFTDQISMSIRNQKVDKLLRISYEFMQTKIKCTNKNLFWLPTKWISFQCNVFYLLWENKWFFFFFFEITKTIPLRR